MSSLLPGSLGATRNREQGPYSCLLCPTPYLMEQEGLNSLCKYPGGCVLHTLSIIKAPFALFFFFLFFVAAIQ